MKITTIQTNQGPQNTARLLDQSGPAVYKKTMSQINSGTSSVKIETIKTPQVQGRVRTASISSIKEQLDQVLVNYPPFFPLGTLSIFPASSKPLSSMLFIASALSLSLSISLSSKPIVLFFSVIK